MAEEKDKAEPPREEALDFEEEWRRLRLEREERWRQEIEREILREEDLRRQKKQFDEEFGDGTKSPAR